MKSLHRADLYSWDVFDEARNIDFHGVIWVRPGGSVVVDPVPMSAHDAAHLERLGPVAWIVVTNSDHVRDAAALAAQTGARIAGPRGEAADFPIPVDRWLDDGEELVPGLSVITLEGSKTPGEIALLLEDSTLITGDLVRAHRAGSLMMLPSDKLRDREAAARSIQRLARIPSIRAVLVGDGFQVFRDGHILLAELSEALH